MFLAGTQQLHFGAEVLEANLTRTELEFHPHPVARGLVLVILELCSCCEGVGDRIINRLILQWLFHGFERFGGLKGYGQVRLSYARAIKASVAFWLFYLNALDICSLSLGMEPLSSGHGASAGFKPRNAGASESLSPKTAAFLHQGAPADESGAEPGATAQQDNPGTAQNPGMAEQRGEGWSPWCGAQV